MAEETKKKFDPEATIAQPAAGQDPDATVALPAAAADPEATVSGPIVQAEPDPEATFTPPGAKKAPDGTDKLKAFDPDATVNPAERASLDPDATVRVPSPGKLRNNPFAPKSLPDSIQANLAALGGLNSLIALANPILGAVPQIRRALRHPDPAALRANLRDQIESLQTSANFAEVSDAAVEGAVYALCALLDESAAATPWGGTWIDNGLLKDICNASGGGEGFFKRLDAISASQGPDDVDSADLLEFYDVCLALGFEGRYRNAEGGRQALNGIRNGVYAIVSRRRPRPDGLSAHWRSATAEAAAAPALQMAAKVSAQISAHEAAGASAESTLPPASPPSFLSRVPRRAVWSALAGIVGASIAFYMLALRLQEDDSKTALASGSKTKSRAQKAAAAPAPAPAAPAASPTAGAALARALEGEPVNVTEDAGRVALTLRHEQQFAPGDTQPAAELRPLLQKIAAALDKAPGAIVVAGYADASPTRRYASNQELSAARAQSVARLMAPGFVDPKRLSAEGKGEAEPVAPSDTDANRAKNRRIAIFLKPAP